MISYHFVPISSQKGVLFLRHPVDKVSFQSFSGKKQVIGFTPHLFTWNQGFETHAVHKQCHFESFL